MVGVDKMSDVSEQYHSYAPEDMRLFICQSNSPKPKDITSTNTEEWEKKQIFAFEKLEPLNFRQKK